jgi:hypothetical protein
MESRKETYQEVGLSAALRSRGTFFSPWVTFTGSPLAQANCQSIFWSLTEQSNGTNYLGSIYAKTKQNRVQNGIQGSCQGAAAQFWFNAMGQIWGGFLVLDSMDLASDLLHPRLQSGHGRILGGDGRGDGCKHEEGDNGGLHIEWFDGTAEVCGDRGCLRVSIG